MPAEIGIEALVGENDEEDENDDKSDGGRDTSESLEVGEEFYGARSGVWFGFLGHKLF